MKSSTKPAGFSQILEVLRLPSHKRSVSALKTLIFLLKLSEPSVFHAIFQDFSEEFALELFQSVKVVFLKENQHFFASKGILFLFSGIFRIEQREFRVFPTKTAKIPHFVFGKLANCFEFPGKDASSSRNCCDFFEILAKARAILGFLPEEEYGKLVFAHKRRVFLRKVACLSRFFNESPLETVHFLANSLISEKTVRNSRFPEGIYFVEKGQVLLQESPAICGKTANSLRKRENEAFLLRNRDFFVSSATETRLLWLSEEKLQEFQRFDPVAYEFLLRNLRGNAIASGNPRISRKIRSFVSLESARTEENSTFEGDGAEFEENCWEKRGNFKELDEKEAKCEEIRRKYEGFRIKVAKTQSSLCENLKEKLKKYPFSLEDRSKAGLKRAELRILQRKTQNLRLNK